MKRVITYGTFDLLHYGHIELLRRAKEQGDYLVVARSTDEFNQLKGKTSYFPYATRKRMLEAIRYVDLVIPQVDMDKVAIVRKYGVQAVFVGSDWKGTAKWEKFQEEFAAEGCDVIYLPRTEGISSSSLRDRVNEI